jgi:hypothetical protein
MSNGLTFFLYNDFLETRAEDGLDKNENGGGKTDSKVTTYTGHDEVMA